MSSIERVTGRAWVFGNDIDTDVLAPGLYMKGGLEKLAAHCLESVRPEFASGIQPGDIIVAGYNFGIGSSREQAAQVLKALGCGCILAASYGGIFYRNTLNFGLPALTLDDPSEISDGDRVQVDIVSGKVANLTRGTEFSVPSLPDHLARMVAAGGMVPLLKQRLSENRP